MPRNIFHTVTLGASIALIALPALAAQNFHGENIGYFGLLVAMIVAIVLLMSLVRRPLTGLLRRSAPRLTIYPFVACLLLVLVAPLAFAASPTVTLAVPAGSLYAQIIGASGVQYTPNAAGQISVSNSADVKGFQSAGFVTIVPGTTPTELPLLYGVNSNGSVLVSSSAAAGNFLISLTPGTSEALTGEAAQGNTKTDAVVFEFVIPATYVAGNNLTVTVNANYSGTGTAGTKTLAAAAYLAADAGTQGSTLGATSAQTITSAAAAYAFTITGTTLTPGQRLLIKLTTVMQETGGSASLTAQINSATAG